MKSRQTKIHGLDPLTSRKLNQHLEFSHCADLSLTIYAISRALIEFWFLMEFHNFSASVADAKRQCFVVVVSCFLTNHARKILSCFEFGNVVVAKQILFSLMAWISTHHTTEFHQLLLRHNIKLLIIHIWRFPIISRWITNNLGTFRDHPWAPIPAQTLTKVTSQSDATIATAKWLT